MTNTIEVITNVPDEKGYPILEIKVTLGEKIVDVRMDSEGIFAKDLELTPLIFNQKMISRSIDEAQEALDLSALELDAFVMEITKYAKKFMLLVYQKRTSASKCLDECPYIDLSFDDGGNPKFSPNIVAISKHFIE